MKKRIGLICVMLLILSAAFMTACGTDKEAESKYVGTWKCESARMGGSEVDVEDVMEEFTVQLGEDGKASIVVDGNATNCQWEPTDDGFDVESKDSTMSFKEDGSLMVYTRDDVEMKFKKK